MDPKRDGCYCPISPLHFQIGRYVMRGAERGLRGRRDVEASESLVHNPEEAGCSAAGDCNVMGPFTLAANSDVGTIYSRAEYSLQYSPERQVSLFGHNRHNSAGVRVCSGGSHDCCVFFSLCIIVVYLII